MFSHNLLPCIDIATRVTEASAKCLDHIWYNRNNVIVSGALIADISDHYPIFCALNVFKNNKPIKKIIRDLSEKSVKSFLEAMPVFVRDYERECEAKDVDFRTLWLVEKIQKMFDKHCPLKTKVVSYKQKLYKTMAIQGAD